MATAEKRYVSFRIRKRPLWYWIGFVVWAIMVLLSWNTAVASEAEREPTATTLGYVMTLVLLGIGLAIHMAERRRAERVTAVKADAQ